MYLNVVLVCKPGTSIMDTVKYPDLGRKPQRPRAELLTEIEALPDNAYVTAEHAAAYLNTSVGVLSNWRSQRRGPQYEGAKGFIRYRLRALKAFMAQRASEVPTGCEFA
jgi:hypothetical protein